MNDNLLLESEYSQPKPDPLESFGVSDRYDFKKVLGQGAYGVVCSAFDKRTSSGVAIKRIDQINSVLVARRTLRELKLLRHFRNHPNIISVFDVYKKDSSELNELYITQELMDTDMYQLTQSKYQFSDEHIQAFMYQILRGLKAIHSANVLHRDLKPGNLLWKNTGEIKICDFGLARGLDEQGDAGEVALTNYVATRWYRPPEILLYKAQYGRSLDIWSVGCIFAEFLGRKVFLPGQSGFEQLQLILQKLGTPEDDVIDRIPSEKSRIYLRRLPKYQKNSLFKRFPDANVLAVDLLEKMLQFEPSARISAEEALKHPYLARFHDPAQEPVFPPFDFSFDAACVSLTDLKNAILQEIALNYLSSSLPSINHHTLLKDHSSRDPTQVQPTNVMQGSSTITTSNHGKHKSYSLSRSGLSDSSVGHSTTNTTGSISRTSSAEKFGRATKNFYEAFKRGLKRLGSIRRNNSA